MKIAGFHLSTSQKHRLIQLHASITYPTLNTFTEPSAMYKGPAHSDLRGPVARDLPYN